MSFRLSSKSPNQTRNTDDKIEAKQKYFFVLEGEKTEHIYIRELSDHVREDALADIVLLERMEGSHSNQYKITESINNYIESNASVTTEQRAEILELCMNFDDNEILEVDLVDRAKNILGDLAESFITDYNNNVIEQIKLLNELRNYEKGFDKICLILDRDYRSFKDDQYNRVIEICNQNDFLLGITNPNFEFYLLLHINDAQSLEKESLIKNVNMANSKKKYCEYKLNELIRSFGTSYKKKKYDAKFFIEKFPELLENIQHYQNDNEKLKDELGTSVHKIISDLL